MMGAGSLSLIGPKAKSAIPALKLLLKDKDVDVRLAAANALGKVGCNPDEFIDVVVDALRESSASSDFLDFRLDILVDYKEHAKSAIPVLLDMLKAVPESSNLTNMMDRQRLLGVIQQISPETIPKSKRE